MSTKKKTTKNVVAITSAKHPVVSRPRPTSGLLEDLCGLILSTRAGVARLNELTTEQKLS